MLTSVEQPIVFVICNLAIQQMLTFMFLKILRRLKCTHIYTHMQRDFAGATLTQRACVDTNDGKKIGVARSRRG